MANLLQPNASLAPVLAVSPPRRRAARVIAPAVTGTATR
nr:L25 [uncultured bacterium]